MKNTLIPITFRLRKINIIPIRRQLAPATKAAAVEVAESIPVISKVPEPKIHSLKEYDNEQEDFLIHFINKLYSINDFGEVENPLNDVFAAFEKNESVRFEAIYQCYLSEIPQTLKYSRNNFGKKFCQKFLERYGGKIISKTVTRVCYIWKKETKTISEKSL